MVDHRRRYVFHSYENSFNCDIPVVNVVIALPLCARTSRLLIRGTEVDEASPLRRKNIRVDSPEVFENNDDKPEH